MDRCRVEVISATPNPQQVMYAAMHQDYSENFVVDERPQWPNEEKAGELIVKRLLAGERGHYGPLEHPQIVLNCGFFPHSVMQQARTHRVGISFDVQSMRLDLVQMGTGRIDIDTGSELWKHELPTTGNAVPMTYTIQGRQYLVIAAGGHFTSPLPAGDHLVAFRLAE